MTEEIKIEETKDECKCCECKEKLKEFIFKTLIVYVGVTLAIITSANILKPKFPCKKMMRPPMGIERQMPPHKMHKQFGHKMERKQFAPPQVKIEKQKLDVKVEAPKN